MEEITGAITEKTIKEGISGSGKPWTMVCFTINNKQYNSFDAKIRTDHKIGDNVKMTGEQDGKYWKLLSMTKIDDVFTASESVNTLKTPEVERVVTPALRTTRSSYEVTMSGIMETSTKQYCHDSNIDGLKFSDIVEMNIEEYVKGVKQLEKELGI
jgi:hypothetical protein